MSLDLPEPSLGIERLLDASRELGARRSPDQRRPRFSEHDESSTRLLAENRVERVKRSSPCDPRDLAADAVPPLPLIFRERALERRDPLRRRRDFHERRAIRHPGELTRLVPA